MKAIHGVQVLLGAMVVLAEAVSHNPDARLAALGAAAVPVLAGVLTLFGLVSHSAVPGAVAPPSDGSKP